MLACVFSLVKRCWPFELVAVLIVGVSAAASAAPTAEPGYAPVCPGAARTPHRYVTAAHTVHHLTDAAGPAEYVALPRGLGNARLLVADVLSTGIMMHFEVCSPICFATVNGSR